MGSKKASQLRVTEDKTCMQRLVLVCEVNCQSRSWVVTGGIKIKHLSVGYT